MPSTQLQSWCEDWTGDFWRWLLNSAASGDVEARRAVRKQLIGAWRAALAARRGPMLDHPLLPIAAAAALLAIMALASHGFAGTRRQLQRLPFPDADRLVTLAQGPPTLGVRLGFLDREAELLRRRNASLESLATYGWFNAKITGRDTLAAAVGPDFFRVLGAGPETGDWQPADRTFLVSAEYFERELHADSTAIGRVFQVGDSNLTLTGVLPRQFSFLGLPISVWIPSAAHVIRDADKKWWFGLRGTVARLKPGVTEAAVESELRQILVSGGYGRRNYHVFAMPVRTIVNRPLYGYGGLILAVIAGWIGWTAFAAYRSGEPWRFWGYFLAKSLVPVLVIFLTVFEFLSNRSGSTSVNWWGRELVALWTLFCSVALTAVWAWRDQKRRCRTCLSRLREPIRIGTSWQMLLDPSGEEIMCPRGHGTVFTSTSLIGQELSDHWVDFNSKSLS